MTVRLPEPLTPVPDAAERFAWAEREERTVEGLHICGADLSGTRYEGLRLRGVIVTAEQAAMLAKRLGLVIKE